MITLKRILLPTDFSDTAAVALKYAKVLAQAFGSALHVLHVLEDPLPGWKPSGLPSPVPIIRTNMQRDADIQIAKLVKDAELQQFDVKTATPWGSAFVEIIRYAKANNIDLIVMGTHGNGPILHMLLGSVAENVVRKARCPVLTVRHPDHQLAMP